MSEALEDVLAEQARYYRDRAREYEDWWFRRGRYDHGADANARWFAEVAQLREHVQRAVPAGARVLELACGTGLWTEQLARRAGSLTALDASPEMLELARAKPADAPVRFIEADIFEWQPDGPYDLCFFGFWLSHVPRVLMADFWEKVSAALARGGRAYFLDSARSELAGARDQRSQGPEEELTRRRLEDGRQYTIVKHWFDGDALAELLAGLGWRADISRTGEFFLHGSASPVS